MPDLSDAAAMGKVDDAFLFEMIKKGSSQFGRSNAMPAWGMQLTDDEIRALVAYIRTLAAPAQPPRATGKGTP
jgi:mono/diheme cytochrome c family protein